MSIISQRRPRVVSTLRLEEAKAEWRFNVRVSEGRFMYLWHVDRLVEDFKKDAVSEQEKLKYLLLDGALTLVSSDPLLRVETVYSAMDGIALLVFLLGSLAGIYYGYVCNRGTDGHDFITRFVCVGLPSAIRIFVVVFLPLALVVGLLEGAYSIGIEIDESGSAVFRTTLGQIVCEAVSLICYYRYVGKKLQAIAAERRARDRTVNLAAI